MPHKSDHDKLLVEIVETFNEKCYVCGRTPHEFESTFKFEGLPAKIKEVVTGRQTNFQRTLDEYLTHLRTVYADTSAYEESVTVEEILDNTALSKKIMPLYDSLLMFSHDPEEMPPAGDTYSFEWRQPNSSKPDVTIGQMRNNLKQIITALEEGHWPNFLAYLAPELVREKMSIPVSGSQKFRFAPLLFSKFAIACFRDMSGKEVIEQSVSGANDEYWSEYYYPEDYNREYSSRRLKENAKPMPLNQVVKFVLYCVLCPMCDRMFSRASNAAYQTIHENVD